MRRVTKIQTFDGLLFDTVKEARRYLDNLYGDKLTRFSHKLTKETDGKYTRIIDFLDNKENMSSLLELDAIKADLQIEPEDEED